MRQREQRRHRRWQLRGEERKANGRKGGKGVGWSWTGRAMQAENKAEELTLRALRLCCALCSAAD